MNVFERCEHDKTHNCATCGYIRIDGEKVFFKDLVLKGAISEMHLKFVNYMAEKNRTIDFFFHKDEIHIPEGQGKVVGLATALQLQAWEYLYNDIEVMKAGLVSYLEELKAQNLNVLSGTALQDLLQIIEDGGIGKRPLVGVPRLNYKYSDVSQLIKRIGKDEVEKHFKAAPFEATSLWAEEDYSHFSYFKINHDGPYIFNKPNRFWWECKLDDSGELYDLFEIKRFLEAFRLVGLIGSLEEAETAISNCPNEQAYFELHACDGQDGVSYWVKSWVKSEVFPDGGFGKWACRWDGQYWEPSDDGYITNLKLDSHKSQFRHLNDVVDAVQRVRACQ